jgi:dual specificity phosphatase 12
MNDPQQPKSRRPSINVTVSRRPSAGQLRSRVNSRGENGPPFANLGRGLSDQLSMSAVDTEDDGQINRPLPRRPSTGQAGRSNFSSFGDNQPLSVADLGRGLSDSLSMSVFEPDDDDQNTISNARRPSTDQPRPKINLRGDAHHLGLTGFGRGLSDSLSMSALDTDDDEDHHIDAMHLQARSRTSSTGDNRPTKPSPLHENFDPMPDNETESIEASRSPAPVVVSVPASSPHSSTSLANPLDLIAQLNSDPKLAGHRSPRLMSQMQAIMSPISPPILVNPKCSGYFVEPVSHFSVHLQIKRI